LRLDENARRRLILDQLGIKVRDPSESDAWLNFDCDGATAELFERSRVPMFNAPGTGALGDKALLPFVDDLIGFYLNEKPILRTPPTYLLSDGVLPSDPAGWVVKTTAGCQGTEVFVLDWQPKDRLGLIAERAVRAVAQRYVEPSRLTLDGPGGWDAYRVEIRPVAYVLGWNDVYVSECPVGKAISVYDSRRLNNISHGACYIPVLLE
jgi:glutamate---cysteine ligase / carboxylate-amine ligase